MASWATIKQTNVLLSYSSCADLSDLQLHDTVIPEEDISSGDFHFLITNDNAGTLRDVSSLHSAQYLEVVQASCGPLDNFPVVIS
jgi:hypothetical protein